MPISVRLVDDRWSCPVVVCDHCGLVIEDAKDGTTAWDPEIAESQIASPVFFVHKACFAEFKFGHPQECVYTGELLDLLPRLVKNLQLDWDKAKRRVEYLAKNGL
jgi:hypothetical protein